MTGLYLVEPSSVGSGRESTPEGEVGWMAGTRVNHPNVDECTTMGGKTPGADGLRRATPREGLPWTLSGAFEHDVKRGDRRVVRLGSEID